MVKLSKRHIRKGEPLHYDLLDEHGKVLLKNGYVIDDQEQIDRLIERGAFFDEIIEEEPEAPRVDNEISVFRKTCDLLDKFETVATQKEHDHTEIYALAVSIQELCLLDSDACLANIQLYKRIRYSLRHSFHAAILTELLLKHLNIAQEVRAHVVSGALTMNFSMLELQDACYKSSEPLSLEQKQAIITHPMRTVEYLQKLGVDNPVWLQVVEHHHEAINGAGYPKRLKKDDLNIFSQAVSLADRYCAMITERAYRPGTAPDAAAKLLVTRDAVAIEPVLTDTFLKVVGYFPPGTTVRLTNGEAALVTKRLLNPAQPLVRSLRSSSGRSYENPPKRATSHPSHEIQEAIGANITEDVDLDSFWRITLPDANGNK